ncbi:MAG: HEPN domain-containing protein [Burkholderiales bacterium]
MANAKTEEIQRWMAKASHDLTAAITLLNSEVPLTDIAVYHCQQAAEKALKAYLIEMDTPFTKTHDLDELVSVCATLDNAFSDLSEPAAVLTPYAIAFRYPTGQPDPTLAEADHAIQCARGMIEFVASRLSKTS